MNLYISTIMYPGVEFQRIYKLLEHFQDIPVGVEVFPCEYDEEYANMLCASIEKLKGRPVTFHGPYYGSEYSVSKESKAFERSLELLRKTLEYAKCMGAKHIVFHHNNCEIKESEREKRIANSRENQLIIASLCEEAGIPVVVENAGVKCAGTMLFDEAEFIAECLAQPYPVLIDIGHANANGWNLRHVMKALRHKIICYHLHNNDGGCDSHQRIFNGTLDFEEFLKDFFAFTPEADIVLEYSPTAANEEEVVEDIRSLLTNFREEET